jgi:holo-[acyl-carrier protein] synthase
MYDAAMPILGHGIDIVEIERIARMLDEHGERFIDRCFTADERAYAESGPAVRVERYAARFACKEAALKALGTGWSRGISWHDVEVRPEPSGRPLLSVTGRAAEIAADLGIIAWHISISHTRACAVASAIAWGIDRS